MKPGAESGALSAPTVHADAVERWLDGCPVKLAEGVRAGMRGMLRQ